MALALSPVAAQTKRSEVVVVQTIETGGEVRVVIAYGSDKTEVVTFKDYFSKDASQKGPGAGAVGYQKVFAKLYQEGYSVKSTFATGGGITSTLVFVREKE